LTNKESSIKSKYYTILELYDSIELIKGDVCYNKNISPNEVDELEYQDYNYRGLFWWYNRILKEIAESNAKK